NDRFAKPAYSENDLFDNLTVHCYDIDIHESRHNRQLNNTLLIDFLKLNLHSTEAYIKDEINNNVKSIISRITDMNTVEDDSEVDLSQENKVESADNDDEIENLSKQPLFNLQTANQFKSALEIFMK